jgi:hypothetical protein
MDTCGNCKSEKEEFLKRFQAKLDEIKKGGSPGCTVYEHLSAMLANMSKVNTSGVQLILSPFGSSHRFEYHREDISVEKRDYDTLVKLAIVTAIENIIHMYSIHLQDLKRDIKGHG